MYYKKLTSGNTVIEFHNNWLGEETVIVNGQVVSKKSSILGTDHPFTVPENGEEIRYVLTTRINEGMQVVIDLKKDGEMVQGNVPVPFGSRPKKPKNKAKDAGLINLKEYDLAEALQDFKKALETTPDDPEIHFFMACIHSVQEKPEEGFEALKTAVEKGLPDQEAILNHDMLAFLRMHPAFEGFLTSGFTAYDRALMGKTAPEIPADYRETNRALWNAKTPIHLDSDFYNMPAFLAGESSLKSIETGLLGDLNGKTVLHLQCHFGQDSLSMARLGAHVTGVDLSDTAIEKARELNDQLGLDARFICCDLYDLPRHLDETFDIVFTSYGVIGWLPDMERWAAVVARYLRPGGRFIFVEFHPFIWMLDEKMERFQYSYFNHETIIEEMHGTYADREADIHLQEVSWNHPLDEVLQALIDQGLQLKHFREYDYSPYDCFPFTRKDGPDEYRIAHYGRKLPMVYSVVAIK